jgi:hypothetical protein
MEALEETLMLAGRYLFYCNSTKESSPLKRHGDTLVSQYDFLNSVTALASSGISQCYPNLFFTLTPKKYFIRNQD